MQTIPLNIVSDYFISLSNETQSLITNLKLQKLVYYAEAWNLTINGHSLISEEFEAWVHGPVIPALYVQYKEFGWKPIVREDLGEGSLANIEAQLSPPTKKLLSDISEEYFGLNAFELERLTHEEDPWKITRGDLPEDAPSHKIIDKKLMSEYYKQYV